VAVIFDTIIIGGGPAGYTAAMYAARAGLSVLVVEMLGPGGQMTQTTQIDNYPGFDQGVDGITLGFQMQSGAHRFGAQTRYAQVRQLELAGKIKKVHLADEVLECRTVILATGADHKHLGLPREQELVGKGVAYCATCDGMFYRGKRIAVLSASLQGVEETHFLAGLASEVDYYSLRRHQTDGLDGNVKVMTEKPVSIGRDDAGITLTTKESTHCYDGIFIFRSAMPLNMLIADLETEGGYIPVDRQMRTNIPGVFAAGDCTGKPLQVPKAVGEGNVAAISAAEWIAKIG